MFMAWAGECLEAERTWFKRRITRKKLKNEEETKFARAGCQNAGRDRFSVFSEYSDYTALNLEIIRSHHNRRHFRICRLEADFASTFAVKPFKCGFFAANQSNDNIARVGHLRLFAHNVVAVHDVIFNHGATLHLKHEGVAATGKIAKRQRFAFFDGFQRAAPRDPANQRQFLNLPVANLFLHGLRQLKNFDRAALVVTPANESFFLERGDVLVNSGKGGELQALADLFKTWGVPVLVVKRNQVVQNFFLPLCKGHRSPPAYN